MDLQIIPKKLSGAVTPPPSKSQAHRLLIAAALSGGVSVLHGLAESQDIQATRRCLSALGAGMEDLPDGALRVHGLGHGIVMAPPYALLDCGESGSTLRFLIPVALLVQGGVSFTGRGRLMERPLKPYEDLFREKGVAWKLEDHILTVNGGRGYDALALDSGAYRLPGNVSSQFFTGLLFTLPLLNGDSTLMSTTPLESRDYLELTRQVQALAGVRSRWQGDALFIPGGQRYRPFEAAVEADWSQAAFWYAANHLGGQVDILGMDPASRQGDREIAAYSRMLARSGQVELDVSQCPDLAPPLAAMAAVRTGTTRLTNAARLRAKESDRLASVTRALRAMGGQVEEYADSLTIHGVKRLPGGGVVDCANDHRIAMMAAVCAASAEAPVKLLGAECVRKSYPEFWTHFQSLGGELHGLILR